MLAKACRPSGTLMTAECRLPSSPFSNPGQPTMRSPSLRAIARVLEHGLMQGRRLIVPVESAGALRAGDAPQPGQQVSGEVVGVELARI